MTLVTREPLARKVSRRRNLNGKEVRGMADEAEERRHRVAIIKETTESANNGRSYLLKGLDQRQLAEAMGSTQATVEQLERDDRGAYPKTIVRLCAALGVAPEDLLSGDSPSELKKSVDQIRR
jgi:DNA-binding Xre family transcriptional regulator